MDKPHYYDGKLYARVIDPFLKEIRDLISANIESGSTVVDIGCGTGALVFDLAEKCASVTGVELSLKMVEHAKQRRTLTGKTNIFFEHGNASHLPQFRDSQFDYATISMALHEMPRDVRVQVLREAKRIAKTIIIADYAVPLPWNFAGIQMRMAEFFAGPEHFKGFRDVQRTNGIDLLLRECQLSMSHESLTKNQTIRVIVVF